MADPSQGTLLYIFFFLIFMLCIVTAFNFVNSDTALSQDIVAEGEQPTEGIFTLPGSIF